MLRISINCCYLYFLSCLLLLPLNASAYDVNGELSVTPPLERFQTEDIDLSNAAANLVPTNINTAISTFNGSTYFVWVNDQRQPMLTKITGENSVTYPLDKDPDYQAQADNHHTFSLGIDKDGFIHVVGDMHNYRPPRAGYLSRFDSASSMYWVSNTAEDISSFSFVGDHATRNLALGGYSYCQFYNDYEMEMYLLCRVSLYPSGFFPGIRGLGLAHYDVDTQQWQARGNLPNYPEYPNPDVKTILWENNGSYSVNFPVSGYQGYQSTMIFDSNNRMHLGSTINNDDGYLGSTHVVYAYSDDGGLTFHRANDSLIGDLPMRVENLLDANGVSRQADIVYESTSSAEYVWNFAGIYLNGKGSPSIGYWPNGTYPNGWTWINSWDPVTQTWSAHYDQVTSGGSQTLNRTDANGVLTYFSPSAWGEIIRTTEDSALPTTIKKSWAFRKLVSLDRLALRHEGVFRFVAISQPLPNQPDLPTALQVVDFDFKNTGSFTREVWYGVYGNSLDALTASTDFPHSPGISEEVEGNLQTTANIDDSYATRLRGMIHPPEDGDYEFWIAGDNNSELWLSTDATVGNAEKIATVSGWTLVGEWDKYSQQYSGVINLKADRRYYFEVVHKEGGGGDHVGVAWTRPSVDSIDIISGEYLTPWLGIAEGAFQ